MVLIPPLLNPAHEPHLKGLQKIEPLKLLRSVLRTLLSNWKSGKLSQESGGWASRAQSMSTVKRDQNFSACSANKSGHQANACMIIKQHTNVKQRQERSLFYAWIMGGSCRTLYLKEKQREILYQVNPVESGQMKKKSTDLPILHSFTPGANCNVSKSEQQQS